ncbi:MAG: hypothetical protein RL385_5643 [Pseudomonadota bacterium]|jgi:hypothetical protein
MLIRRMSRLVEAVFGEQLSELEVNHASALLESEREELAQRVARFNQGLAVHAAMCERLRLRICTLERDEAALVQRLKAQLASGDRAGAGRAAFERERIQTELAQKQAEHVAAEAAYQELLEARSEAVDVAKRRLNGLRSVIDEQRLQSSLADLTEMAAEMHGTLVHGGATTERLTEKLVERRELAVGRLRVAREGLAPREVRVQREEACSFALLRFEAAQTGGTSEGGDP